MNPKVGNRIKITYKGEYFNDTGKIGTVVSMMGSSAYYVYIEGSKNNVHNCKDKYGNKVTWNLSRNSFEVLDRQMVFPFMEEV